MKTSPRGIAFLERHEGVVLRAYRDVAGVWTIGAGLTKASGVVTPRAGMVISRVQASALLARALARNYEPAVAAAMPRARQHEFDGGVSFHFNTGAIRRANWVSAWAKRDWAAVRNGLAAWCRAGGKVVRGLTLRRQAEYELIRLGHYGDEGSAPTAPAGQASWSPATISAEDREAVRRGLLKLGYATGTTPGVVSRGAAEQFQRAHGLTVDGVIGRATRDTMQRMLNARVGFAAAGATTAVPVAGVDLVDTFGAGQGLDGDPSVAGLPGLLWLAWLAYTHRDAIAALVQDRLPGLARYLRSF